MGRPWRIHSDDHPTQRRPLPPFLTCTRFHRFFRVLYRRREQNERQLRRLPTPNTTMRGRGEAGGHAGREEGDMKGAVPMLSLHGLLAANESEG